MRTEYFEIFCMSSHKLSKLRLSSWRIVDDGTIIIILCKHVTSEVTVVDITVLQMSMSIYYE